MVPYFGGRLTFQIIGVTPAAEGFSLCKKQSSISPKWVVH